MISKILLENNSLILERMFARLTDLENYAGGSISSW
jgi:hypothetical protein